ncbi:phospholipid carrier-dependent glycosyltransferase [Microbulbifer thermotolerans]|uniref:phospholipid carrier-dependent glycosyltransferase n=1 Tax=Microbulbifer thermotolerans TaxID=252514 RepID=UPI0012E91A41|nr:phospholipid carrier-dependent glycosyltransferase [Microbulbifer thermotolerans]MCX2793857.1 phospholipid carrier-dependent glycosyltransferase [Microbulbifer thermotolerans]
MTDKEQMFTGLVFEKRWSLNVQESHLVWMLLAFFVSVLVHVAIGYQDLVYLDRTFLPDDTYYTLSIAKNLALGRGPSTDGVILTSGFQPLFAFILVPVFWILEEGAGPVYAAIALSALFGVVNTCLIGFLIKRITQSYIVATLAMLFVTSSPVLLKNNFNGLETSLSSFFALSLLLLVGVVRKDSPWWHMVIMGICSGLALLSRIDNCFIVFLVGVWSIFTLGFKKTVFIVLAALGVVAPWWLYCFFSFGSVIPESGMAVKQIVGFHQELHLTLSSSVDKSLLALNRPVSMILDVPVRIYVVLFLFAIAVSAYRIVKFRRLDEVSMSAIVSVLLFLFYTFYLSAFWFFDRYYHFLFLCLIVCVAYSWNAVFLWLSRKENVSWFRYASLFLMLCAIVINLTLLKPLRSSPDSSLYAGDEGARGYGEVAQEIINELPDGSTIAAMQSGALGYYANRNIRVINLDGVVNRNAYLAIKDSQLAEYLRVESVEYFSDWGLNVLMLLRYSGVENYERLLSPVRNMKPQGQDRFTIYRINESL